MFFVSVRMCVGCSLVGIGYEVVQCVGWLICVLCVERCRRLVKVFSGVSRLLARWCENESGMCIK